MNAPIIYQMPVNNSLLQKSWLWEIFTHVILGKNSKYESLLEHLYYWLQLKRHSDLTFNIQLTFKNCGFLQDPLLNCDVKVYLISF